MSHTEGPCLENDPVRPGEQWFCYWKTSAALWESRILETPAHEVIFLPLYWGFHAENQNQWDFGEIHAERDLLRLSQLLTRHGRRFTWLLPITPAPFLPNGGVPVSAARTLSVCSDGVHMAMLDQDGKMNKIYSYFEPKVFQTFSGFLHAFGEFLSRNKIKAQVWGMSFNYTDGAHVHSYLSDSSLAFEQGFSRYLKQNFNSGIDLKNPAEEERIKQGFSREVQDLFRSAAESVLAPFWQDVQEVTILGGGVRHTIERALPSGRTQFKFFHELFRNYMHGRWISSVLLSSSEKQDLLQRALLEHFGGQEIEKRYQYQGHGGSLSCEWRELALLDLISEDPGHFTATGLMSFLDSHFRWMYNVHKELDFASAAIEEEQHKIKFFHGASLDRVKFGQMLKLFMLGQRVVLDRAGLAPELDRRLQVFFVENNLKVQAVNFVTNITLCELGDGKFLTYEGDKLLNESGKDFWPNFFRYLGLVHPKIEMEADVFALWRIREASSMELNYLDVRRVNFYNPTSYKKKISIQTQSNFALMKVIDPSKAQAKSVLHCVEVELMPNGRVALDFGHYEET